MFYMISAVKFVIDTPRNFVHVFLSICIPFNFTWRHLLSVDVLPLKWIKIVLVHLEKADYF